MHMHYYKLFLMAALSYISMYILMYVMVDEYANVYANLNQAYMAGLMTVPMIIIELLLMRSMYHDPKRNALIIVCSLIVGIGLFFCIRKQVAIGDKEFLKSMIPHHASALLMCEHATLHDSEIQQLCKNIQASQQSEIEFMKAKLQAI